ncbi:MAG: hydroxyectoine utilization dehydratase EutB [Ectothiorhodospiraceae bacterium]|nr:hydroxyectoine utilization dehydratase EutB [Ectothiorhodospiraceae bacterium]
MVDAPPSDLRDGCSVDAPPTALTAAAVHAARHDIRTWVRHTPLVPSPSLSERVGARVWLKLETMQDIGAFKIRGAVNTLLSLSEDERRRGVVTVSTGNHGRAVATAASRLGVRAVVCMSELVPEVKRLAVERTGAEVRIVGRSQDEAEVEANRLVAEEHMVPVHPFDDPRVIAGQGTIGLELLEDLGRVDHLYCGLSGGGLLGGIGLALKSASSSTRVVGVTMEHGAAMAESLRAGRPVAVEELPTLADSLGGGIGLDNRYTFDLVRRVLDQPVLVSEAEIAAAMRFLFREERLVVEGGGAACVAPLLREPAPRLDGNVVCVLSGRNVDPDKFMAVVGEKARAN